jgi:hypothetical protein
MGVSGQRHAPAALYTRYPLDRGLGGPQNEEWRVAWGFSVAHTCKHTTSWVHNTRHKKWGVSTNLCITHWQNCRRRCLSPDCNHCNCCTWKGFSHTERRPALWESRPVAEEMWRMLADVLSCTIDNTSLLSHTLRLPRPPRACGMRVPVSARLRCRYSFNAARELPQQKPCTKCVSAYSAFVSLGIFVVATVLVTGTTVRVW